MSDENRMAVGDVKNPIGDTMIVQFQVVRAVMDQWHGEQRWQTSETIVYALDANGRLWAHNQDTNAKWEVKPLPDERYR